MRHPHIYRIAPRINDFVLGHGLAGGKHSPIGVLSHVGRSSGRDYETPVLVHVRRDFVLMPLTYGPRTQWCRNVLAAGHGVLRVRDRRLSLGQARLVGLEALSRPWRAFYRLTGHREFLRLTTEKPPDPMDPGNRTATIHVHS